MIVLTADQRGSRSGSDLVGDGLALLGRVVPDPLRGFERTAGDELQGVPGDAVRAVAALEALVADGRWSVGLGVGPVELPLPASTRAGRGPAYTAAREAVETAKERHHHVCLVPGGLPDDAAATVRDADAVLALALTVALRWSEEAREAIALVRGGSTQTDAARTLGVTRQAVGQRLGAALFRQHSEAVAVVVRLLEQADAASSRAGQDLGDRAPSPRRAG
ncbi:hypothetical protein [Aquipuribacter hungaricus]|uniref:DNA-binding protein n=1 Tax=Aquipuribacter hungaricus TaxID=545624 RepID=A0ABV7WLK3_9MICO